MSTPVGVYIDESKTIHIISPERKSLFELLHDEKPQNLSNFAKLSISIQLAKIMNTFHCLRHRAWAHGNLTPHNVFVEIPEEAELLE